MNGTVAQLAALVCHANAYLRSSKTARFFPGNSTCRFCDKINFISFKKNLLGQKKEKEIAKTPDDWFEYLQVKKVENVKIGHFPKNNLQISDRMSAGFIGGGGNWGVEVLLPEGRSEYWMARWEVWNKSAPEKKIWRVKYGMISSGKTFNNNTKINLRNVIETLEISLIDIKSFSERNNCSGFTLCFEKALSTLRSGKKQAYHQDISPNGLLPKDAELILDACQSSWVFGGMGSWNDMSFQDSEQIEYEKISDKLFADINSSICFAVNSI